MTNYAQFRNNPATTTSTSTSSNTPEPGVFCSPEDLKAIRDAYVENIGPLTGAIAHYIEDNIDLGMSPAVILDAIQQTGWARRPSPQYLRAILDRLAMNGILTEQQMQIDRIRRREEREQANARRWRQWYAPDQAEDMPF